MADFDKRPNGRTFRFLREIASGGFGSVYLTKVTHVDGFSRILAVKLLHRRWSDNAEISRRMRDEARLLGWLRHRNIVDVADLTSIDGRTAILMEYLEAADLKEIVQYQRKSGAIVPPRCALEIMSAAASALDAAYNRPPYPGEKPLHVIHRDIKPSNIMVDDSGLVKVLDFGVARAEFEARESDTRELQFGSVDYMPPERLMFEPESPASDIYSLAATVFELMSGEKLGKAKGSPARHDGNIIDRLSFLRALVALPSDVAGELDDLFTSALGFDETVRPEASQVWVRCKALARTIGGPSLAEWSESVIPAIFRENNRVGSTASDVMTGRELSEDSFMLSTETSAKAVTPDGGEKVPVSDPRWSALRNAAQAELDVLEDLGLSGETMALDTNSDSISGSPLKMSEVTSDEMFSGVEFEEDTRIASSDEIDVLRKRYGADIVEDPAPNVGSVDIEDTFDDLEDTVDDSIEPQVITAGSLLGHAANFVKESQDDNDVFAVTAGEAETRILSAEEQALVDDNGTKLMEIDEIVEPMAAVEFEDQLPPPFSETQSDLGAETILVGPTEEPFKRSSTADLTVSGGKRRAVASFLLFTVALGTALGGGAFLFKDELFGEQGVFSQNQTAAVGEASPTESTISGDVTISEPVEPADPAEPAEPVETTPSTPQDPVAGMVTFVSVVEPLRKMKVRCGSVSEQGENFVNVPVDVASAGCSVSIWPLSGGRQTARVNSPEEGLYRCFVSGEGTCER